MTMRRWRPLWSYDVEKTEHWLSEMAAEGQHLAAMNRLLRIFTFADEDAKVTNYQIMYDKSAQPLPKGLEHAGWEVAAKDQRWTVLKNSFADIAAFPSPENRLRRNRMHHMVLHWLSALYMGPLCIIFLLLFLGFPGGEPNFYWLIGTLFIGQMIYVIVLNFYLLHKVTVADKKFLGEHAHIDVIEPLGGTFIKWRFNWMQSPDRLEKWLTDMAAQGHVLVQIKGVRFVFEKGQPRQVAYKLDYQWKTSPAYFEVYKSGGWELKFTSMTWFTKYSLWAQPCDKGDAPQKFTNSNQENRVQAQKLIVAAIIDVLIVLAVAAIVVGTNYSTIQAGGLTLLKKVLLLVFATLSSYLIIGVMRSLKSVIRMRRI